MQRAGASQQHAVALCGKRAGGSAVGWLHIGSGSRNWWAGSRCKFQAGGWGADVEWEHGRCTCLPLAPGTDMHPHSSAAYGQCCRSGCWLEWVVKAESDKYCCLGLRLELALRLVPLVAYCTVTLHWRWPRPAASCCPAWTGGSGWLGSAPCSLYVVALHCPAAPCELVLPQIIMLPGSNFAAPAVGLVQRRLKGCPWALLMWLQLCLL